MRVLLLGGTGFIGDATAGRLRTAGVEVVTASRSPRADVHFDVTDPGSLALVLSSPFDVVINLAGAGLSSASADPAAMLAVNSDLPPSILEGLRRAGSAARLVHAASSTERLPGQSADESEYSRTKHLGTQALREAAEAGDTPVTILTVHNTYGPHQPRARFVAAVTDALAAGRPVTLNYPHRVRDFVFIDDVAASIEHAVAAPSKALTEVHIGTGIGLSLKDTALAIADVLHADPGLVQEAPAAVVDPNPVTVSPELGGGYGLCRTSFAEGIRRTVEES